MKYKPHQYQEYATQRIIETPYIALFLEMGLGKTVSTLTAIDLLLHDYFDIDKVLVIAPLRVAEDTWSREVEKWDHLQHLKISKVLGSAAQRRKALSAKADIYVINRENVEWLVSELGNSWDFDTVVIDEISSFKNHQSKRFRALRRVRPMIKRVIGLTGTPAPNSLMDLWAPIYLLDQGERLGKTITGFRDQYFVPGERSGHIVYKWHEKKEAEQRIYGAIKDIAVSMKAEDWLKLPERIDRTVPIRLSEKAAQLYKKLEKELLLEFVDADVVATTAAALSNKLLQMASGAVYDEERGVKEIHEAKLDALEDILEASQGKPVMVFYNYKHSLQRVQQRFPQARILRKGKEGVQDITDWNTNKIPLLLLHPKSAGHGLNLQESNCQTVIWFDQIWSLEEFQQANARVYRQGQTRKIVVMQLVAEGTMDEEVVEAIDKKATGQEELMQAVKARIERIKEAEKSAK
ncbi:DEAD/DEAH box helicase [Paenibacillus larvae]|uniref:DEAD/DEAH box helicase n=2 Tax=Paenibacillus larvae TaxID=1464 RepID=A0AAP5N3D2_9BACL|nr:DEAD/DEAH box helicase [Paenibacillus larvae]UYE92097.1 DEAD/DEAH box helicase [Paenibacillus phage LunBun]UYE92179.1 DEAD/DEAH box helicase [Paenibacillus phage BarryFoster_Benicio]UYL91543.1 DEAD/DEAH box helicase [Paenibacillus phage ABAtENZ]UYL91625.1 DEAD/DEAH box helicase [Paenibacillus phage AJG77]UYL91707.1 DEAD/DEAH box helicase [Paenibacillus phage ApiWellbeing]UYL91869.1 DEAD/DEAH box helicase [Paenibacillus phage Bob]UYL91952.1 DEAD/DEAH box helicase [Paenibacillus phage Carlo